MIKNTIFDNRNKHRIKTTTAVIKNELKYFPMSECYVCMEITRHDLMT